MSTPSLYGIKQSNRNFADPYYWGKNQFNSSFPAALACYMRDANLSAVYLRLDSECKTNISEADLSEVFGTKLPNKDLYFSFETIYDPFKAFVADQLPPIDLVLKDTQGNFIRPLEIKLTTLPDDGTSGLSEEEYGSEIVVRSPTIKYMALSIVSCCNNESDKSAIRRLFSFCRSIRQWENVIEAKTYLPQILAALERFFSEFKDKQQPLLLQPIWKTVGKTPLLADYCLDIFVWSDFALSRLFMDSAKENDGEKITRQQRAALRFARFLYEWSRDGRVYQAPIYDGMTYDVLNDKEFAVNGRKTNKYMRSARLTKLAVKKEEIKKIILGGGQKHLSPERRFDAILYFSTDLFDE